MCGILGMVGQNLTPSAEAFREALSLLRHRGPDQEGYLLEKEFLFGCQRLKIIDLEGGRQPILNETGDILIVFNGEIYNFLELRQELKKKGHKFSTHSDTEVILHLYEEKGIDCLGYLEGMFAFGIYDRKKRICFLARDRFGIKPLFYWANKGEIIFSSETKPILKLLNRPIELSSQAINLYFWLDYIPSPHTIYQEINSLLPGECLIYSPGKLQFLRYYRLEIEPLDGREVEKNIFLVRERIANSVRKHLRSDVEVGLFLSGGIDSSILAYEMKKNLARFKTFNIGFEEPSYSEAKYAELIARKFGSEHKFQLYTKDMCLENLISIIEKMPQPFGDPSVLPTYFVSQMSASFLKVVLSGDGGDEIFGGYQTYIAHRLFNLYKNLPSRIKEAFLTSLLKLLPRSDRYFSLDFCLSRFLRSQSQNELKRHLCWLESFGKERRHLLSEDVYQEVESQYLEFLEDSFISTSHPFTKVQMLDIYTYLSNDILNKSDLASMWNSLELRVPYLDHRIVELGLSLPERLKLRNLRNTKYVLRTAYRNELPTPILKRKKMGFSLPLASWFRNHLGNLLLSLLEEDFLPPYINRGYVRKLLQEHLTRQKNNRKLLWNLTVFLLWLKQNNEAG